MAVSSSVRRQRGPSGVPGTTPVGGGGLVQHVSTYTADVDISTASFAPGQPVIVEATGAGGDAVSGVGGGGGAYAKSTITDPAVITSSPWQITFSADGAMCVDLLGVGNGTLAANGNPESQDPGTGGLASFSAGDVTFNGGNGTPTKGGSPGTAAGNGTNGTSDGVSRGCGGNPPNGTPGVGGKVVITWYGLN